uniref:GRAM domain-containing protein 2B-like isoform X2 n=1 Tax=Myxine glutinosa TaxID=7769 RepID=UPI00358F0F65
MMLTDLKRFLYRLRYSEERGVRENEGSTIKAHQQPDKSLRHTSSCTKSKSEMNGPRSYGIHLRSSSHKRKRGNRQFRRIFVGVPLDESLIDSFSCALQKEMIYQGRLFISKNWICFYARFFNRDLKVEISTTSVCSVKKQKTAMVVPNALHILTFDNEKHMFVSLLSRDVAYDLLTSVCTNLQDKLRHDRQTPVSATKRPISLPLDHSDELVGDETDFTFFWNDKVVEPDSDQLSRAKSEAVVSKEVDTSENLTCKAKDSGITINTHYEAVMKNSQLPSEQNLKDEVEALNDGGNKVKDPTPDPQPVPVVCMPKQSNCMLQWSGGVQLHSLLATYLIMAALLLLSACYLTLRVFALEQKLNELGLSSNSQPSGRPLHPADFDKGISQSLEWLDSVQKALWGLLRDVEQAI